MTTLYKKVGRKYVPYSESFNDYELTIPVGSFMLVYAYQGGGRRYSYKVKPDTAGFEAAAMIAEHSICEAIHEKSKFDCDTGKVKRYTKKQLAIIKEFREKMIGAGGLMPMWWTTKSSYDIAEAAIDAVRDYKP